MALGFWQRSLCFGHRSSLVAGLSLLLCGALGIGLAARADAAPPAADATVNDFGIAQVKFINEQIRRTWQENGLQPAAPATEGEWCRRVFLDVIGRIPSVDEAREFLASKDPNKKSKLVNKLIYDEQYVEEYARNWTTLWTNVLIGRNGGNEQRSMTSRPGMQKYLRDSFARNKPYDKMVYELITATGSTTPGPKDFNGAVNFLVMKVNEEKATLATAEIAKVFLGLQVQCTQCHNHPFNDWKQQKFWELNAFLRQTRALRHFVEGSREIESGELVDQDFGGEGGNAEEAEIYYELRNGLTKVAYPVFVDGTEISRSGYVSQTNRRTELGKLVTQSEFMPKEIANRMWAHFLGYGFTKPIDDLGPHNPATHPELLDYLGQQFRDNSFNLKELIRWITLSEAYSLSSRISSSNRSDDPLLGESPKFTHFYLRQMRAEELYESLLVATEAHKTRGDYEEQEKAKNQWMRQFVIAFGNDEGTEATTFNGTIPQALMMFNGDLIKKATSPEKGSFLSNVAGSGGKPVDKLSYLFLAALTRSPTKTEVDVANKLLVARKADQAKANGVQANANDDQAKAMEDLFWAILNSNEFILNH